MAVGIDEGGRSALPTFLLLPAWQFCNYGIIGRRSKRSTLPLRDLTDSDIHRSVMNYAEAKQRILQQSQAS